LADADLAGKPGIAIGYRDRRQAERDARADLLKRMPSDFGRPGQIPLTDSLGLSFSSRNFKAQALTLAGVPISEGFGEMPPPTRAL
jgi:hypothetical protein